MGGGIANSLTIARPEPASDRTCNVMRVHAYAVWCALLPDLRMVFLFMILLAHVLLLFFYFFVLSIYLLIFPVLYTFVWGGGLINAVFYLSVAPFVDDVKLVRVENSAV